MSRIWCVLLCLTFANGAFAQTASFDSRRPDDAVGATFAQGGPIRLTVADAVSRGFEASHRLAEARAREAGARAAVKGAEVPELRFDHSTARPMMAASRAATWSRTAWSGGRIRMRRDPSWVASKGEGEAAMARTHGAGYGCAATQEGFGDE